MYLELKNEGLLSCCGPSECHGFVRQNIDFRIQQGGDIHRWWADERQRLSTRVWESMSQTRGLGWSNHLLSASQHQCLANTEDLTGVQMQDFGVCCSFRGLCQTQQERILCLLCILTQLLWKLVPTQKPGKQAVHPLVENSHFYFFWSMILNLGYTLQSPGSVKNGDEAMALPKINKI